MSLPSSPLPRSPLPPLPPSSLNGTAKAQDARLQALWRARALRYVLIYLLMGCVLVTLRYQTRAVYPELRDLRATRTELQRQQNELSLTVQTLTSEQRVRTWALSSGMVPYAQASKQTQTFAPPLAGKLTVVPTPAPALLLVRTVWR